MESKLRLLVSQLETEGAVEFVHINPQPKRTSISGNLACRLVEKTWI